jgi:predicted nucleic acid-binding Zn ribbon protein
MTKPDLKSIAEIIGSFKLPFQNKSAYKLGIIENAWIEILGEQAYQKVRKFSVKNGILYVYCDSNSLRHELGMQKKRLLDALNKKIDQELVISDVVFY